MPRVTPTDFYSATPPERIIGTETEYDIQLDPEFNYQKDVISHFLNHDNFSQVGLTTEKSLFTSDDDANGSMFLSNGALAYNDMGYMLEYASAESLGPQEAAAADAAGALIIEKLLHVADTPSRGAYRRAGTAYHHEDLLRPAYATTGHHENFLIPASLAESPLVVPLVASFLSTRMWAWSGIVREDFELCQKLTGIGTVNSLSTPSFTSEMQKPMLHIHNDIEDTDIISDDWARAEVRFADTTHLVHTKYLSLAGVSLAIRLAEHAHRLTGVGDVILDNPLQVAHIANEDYDFRELIPGMRIGPLDIQDTFVGLFEQLDKTIKLPQSERQAIPRLRRLITQLRAVQHGEAPLTSLASEVEWVARRRYLSKKFGNVLLTAANADVFMRDMHWDLLGGFGKQYAALVAKRQKQTPSQKQIKYLVSNPPRHTRASLRAELLSRHDFELHSMQWSSASGVDNSPEGRGAQGTVRWDDPYEFAA